MTHAWCSDPARDAAVRAAEDNRTGPLATLGEAIAALFADAAERSSTVSEKGEGQSGMRTERVTLEITRPAIANYPAPAKHFMWQHLLRDVVRGDRESVRVVEEELSDAWAQRLASLTDERDAAIRERDAARAGAAEDARAYSAESDARAQAQQELQDRCDTAYVPAESAGCGAAERLHRETWLRLERDELIIQRDKLRSRVAELEAATGGGVSSLPSFSGTGKLAVEETQAASGGGEGEPVAWMLEWTDHADLYGSKTQAERAAAGDVVPQPLYRATPQPRGWLTGEERGIIAGITDDDEYTEEGQNIAKGLLARSSPPEVVLPQPPFARSNVAYSDWIMCLDAVRSALAAAGVAVKKVGRE
jgi:hypothetical protein